MLHSAAMAITTIQLSPGTRDLLKSAGRKGETYDLIIRKLLTAKGYVDFMEEQYRILGKEKSWSRIQDLP